MHPPRTHKTPFNGSFSHEPGYLLIFFSIYYKSDHPLSMAKPTAAAAATAASSPMTTALKFCYSQFGWVS